jgi:RNA-splicing ligase RtcB
MLPLTHSFHSFNDLSDKQKYDAYLELRKYAESLREKILEKKDTVLNKSTKIDLLKRSQEESLRRTLIRLQAGANAKRANAQARRDQIQAIYLEMETERRRDEAAAEAGNWERPPRKILNKEVFEEFAHRFPDQAQKIKERTVGDYLRNFKKFREQRLDITVGLDRAIGKYS